MIWLVVVAALLVWKGSVYSEMVQMRQFLGMSEPLPVELRWLGTGCVILLGIVWAAYVLFRKVRPKGSDRQTSMRPAWQVRPRTTVRQPHAEQSTDIRIGDPPNEGFANGRGARPNDVVRTG
jgi:hypothetical protein